MRAYFLVTFLLLSFVLAACGNPGPPPPAECTPMSCEDFGYQCGTHTDNCGNPLECPSCPEGHQCEQAQCIEVCVAKSCAELGYQCGTHIDNCGEPVSCDPCPFGHECDESQCIELSFDEKLASIEGLEVYEVPGTEPGARVFVLLLDQPEDHDDPEGARFQQYLVLTHRSESAPLVLHTAGYGLGIFGTTWQDVATRTSEPTRILEANEIMVEHRFFGGSIATNPNWQKLTIEQSARDTHRIRTLFGELYPGPWLATGVSKGGMTAIFHHRFFPDDLDAIVPYVAPISFGNDPRYQQNIETIGPEDGHCRERVLDMGLEFIERRSEVALHLQTTLPDATQHSMEVLEALAAMYAIYFHISFWQYWGSVAGCDALPFRGAPIEHLVAWVLPDTRGFFHPYAYNGSTGPYSYQVANELGGPNYTYEHLHEILQDIDFDVLQGFYAGPPPWGQSPAFNPAPMLEVDAFLSSDARRTLAIYGEWDPWTAGIINLVERPDNLLLIGPELPHSASIALLPPQMQEQALARLLQLVDPALTNAAVTATVDLSRFAERLDEAAQRDLVDAVSTAEREVLRRAVFSETLLR